MKCTYLINMDDGRLEFNDQYTVEQANLKPIPDDVTAMILSGKVTAKDVISAISIKIKESGEFSIAKYLEDMKKLNVRQSNRQESPERSEPAEVKDDDAVSASDVLAAKDKTGSEPKEEKKARAKKVSEALESSLPDIFSK